MEAGIFELEGRPYYADINPNVPPANEPVRVGRWWGCKDWLLRGAPMIYEGELKQVPASKVTLLERVEKEGPTAREAQLASAARWGVFENKDTVAYVPIGAAEGFALNPTYLTWVGAAGRVEDWRWLADGRMRHNGKSYGSGGVVIGLRKGIAVALISPCIFVESEAA